jgi:polysaccharide pyruvyl transferase WcaK-like protein
VIGTVPRLDFTPSIALLSPCGWGNLGDAAILESAIQAVRKRVPDAGLIALTLKPRDTAERHHIPAFTCTGFAQPYYGVDTVYPWALSPLVSAQEIAPPSQFERHFPSSVPPPSLRSRLRQSFLSNPARLAMSTVRLPEEVRHRNWLEPYTRALRLIIVAGGGQLDDFWGGALGHPYVLWRWAHRARAIGARYVVLSVGTGSLDTSLARLFVRRALKMADYRSYRDEGSRSLLDDPMVMRDPIVPDLAYGLGLDHYPRPASEVRARPVVGISPIAYCLPDAWPVAAPSRYRAYLGRLAEVCTRLVAAGCDLILFGTDGPDHISVEDLRVELTRVMSPDQFSHVSIPTVTSLEQLFDALSGVQAIIASRLHAVLLAHLVGLPVLALSYERKVTVLMASMDHTSYCFPIDEFEPHAVHDRMTDVLANRAQLSRGIVERIATFRQKVEQQYDHVLSPSSPRTPA